MALNPSYVIAPSLQEYFVDKDSGLPMAGGQVFFYQDNARTIPKPVFEISGATPNYTYTQLPNPVTLSAVGTFADASNNDIIPYYYPFDGAGNVQLYYIEVYNSDGVLQFTRQAWPNFIEEGGGNTPTSNLEIENYIANGQFWVHNNIPAWNGNSFTINQVPAPDSVNVTDSAGNYNYTPIAQGGWSFERNQSSTAVDLITFPRFTSTTSPTSNPRFAIQVQTTSAGSDTRKDIAVKFPDVNRFASSTLPYNFYFEAQSSTGSSIPGVEIIVRKFFGTGGGASTTTETIVTTIVLQPNTIQQFNIPIIFGTNVGKSIGTNNDDYVQVIVRLPPTGVQSALFTNFALTATNVPLTSFPTQTAAKQVDESVAGYLQSDDPNGFDLYLPLLLTPQGMTPDHTQIGKVYAGIYSTPGIGELLCNGNQYLTSDYDASGIPYARLQKVLFALGVGLGVQIPLYGTGTNYATGNLLASDTATLRISTNKAGAQTGATNGATATGFTFNTQTAGQTTLVTSYSNGTASNIVYGINAGTSSANAADVNSGCTVVQTVNNSLSYQVFTVTCPAASTITTGHYFTYNTTTTNYYVWFNINGGGGDPTPAGRTGIQVAIPSSYTAQDVANAVREAMNGSQISLVTMTSGSLITGGSYFTFAANSVTYYVWYKVGGSGVAPAGSTTATAIQITLTGTETAAQVVSATQTALNSQYFAVPDFRGLFLRGVRGSGMWDVNAASRWSDISGLFGNNIGTFEVDTFQSHTHTGTVQLTSGGNISIGSGNNWASSPTNNGQVCNNTVLTINPTGQAETQPVNAAVNWFIKF